ncbi:hypothetical protein Tco_1164200 [Tanacetum coccineum]
MTSSSSSDDDGFEEVEEETNEFLYTYGFLLPATNGLLRLSISSSSDTQSDHQHSPDIILRDMKLLNVVITLAFGVLRLKHYMEENVGHMCYRLKLGKEKLQAARDRQKSYADSGRKMTEYEVGENVLLKVSPWKGVMRFGKKGKLAPRYVGPFEILERIGPVAYRLRLPEELIGTLRFVEEPVEIMDREVKSLKRSRIPLVKVRWDSKRGPEFTWEREDYMKSKYPQLFVDRAVEPTS